jgi:glycosyltransferase involved in cell wall biosynthesis
MEADNRHDACVVSVVIPAYGVTQYIAATLESVLNQNFPSFEVIVVNDACPDTEALERELAPYLNRIRYFKHDRNKGVSAARNTAVRAARGEFLALVDGDDVWEPNYLDIQIGHMLANPEADVVYGDAVVFGDTPLAGRRLSELTPSRGDVTTINLLKEQVIVTVSAVVRRETVIRAGYFDERLRRCEDFDLWLRIAKTGGKIVRHSESIFRYRRHEGSLSSDPVGMTESRCEVLDKFGREFDLTLAERETVDKTRRRWLAELKLVQGKELFAKGQHREAARLFQEANADLHRPKLAVASALMRWAPGLVTLFSPMGGRR